MVCIDDDRSFFRGDMPYGFRIKIEVHRSRCLNLIDVVCWVIFFIRETNDRRFKQEIVFLLLGRRGTDAT